MPDEDLVVVRGDLSCQRCAYNLRGLPIDGRCPECGAPVRVAIKRHVLAYADPRWLAKIRGGVRLFTVGGTAGAGIVALGWLNQIFDLPTTAKAESTGSWIVLIGGVLLLISIFVGWWQLLIRNPATSAREPIWTSRRVLRGCVVLILLLGGLGIVGLYLRTPLVLLLPFVMPPFGVLAPVMAVCMGRYVREIADQANDNSTLTKAGAYQLGFVTSWGVLLSCSMVYWMGNWLIPKNGIATIALGTAAISGVMAVAYGVLLFLMPSYLVKRLNEVLDEAKRNWSDGEAPSPINVHDS